MQNLFDFSTERLIFKHKGSTRILQEPIIKNKLNNIEVILNT